MNSSLALRECFLEGKGLGSAPAWLVQDLIDTGDLIRLLPNWEMLPQQAHLVYPSRKYQPQRTRALLFLESPYTQLAQMDALRLWLAAAQYDKVIPINNC